MIVLSAKDIGKSYGVDDILCNVSFHINEGDRIGIVGPNGAGKSTLLNIISGNLNQDSGELFISKTTALGYLKQKNSYEGDKTVYQVAKDVFKDMEIMEKQVEFLAERIASSASKGDEASYENLLSEYGRLSEAFERKGGFAYKSEIKGILKSMGFGEEYFDAVASSLSGGEKTRLALACLLMEKPDILLMDEPTNHLDLTTLTWLEQYLKSYKGTLVIVSHDRYFLNQVANRIFMMENKGLKSYEGNYMAFAQQRKVERESALKAYEKQQREIKRQEDMIRRFKERGTEKLAKRAASREKILKKIDRVEKPAEFRDSMVLNFKSDIESGKDVLKAENLGKSFWIDGEMRELFQKVEFDIKKGERICIVGDNGIGKTTLLKMILGQESITEGYIQKGHNVEMGYYDQGQELLNDWKTLMDEIHDEHPMLKDGEVRGLLGRFMFRNDKVYNTISSLSGGERGRLSLLKLMLSGANLLILDEPTNHLDIESKEVFEEAIKEYEGTVIVVSHDRYFLTQVPTKILELTRDGIVEYLGNYDYYTEKKGQQGAAPKDRYGFELIKEDDETEDSKSEEKLTSNQLRMLKKEQEAKERRRIREKENLEKRIEEMESRSKILEEELSKPEIAADHMKLREISEELGKVKLSLDEAYEKWLEFEVQ